VTKSNLLRPPSLVDDNISYFNIVRTPSSAGQNLNDKNSYIRRSSLSPHSKINSSNTTLSEDHRNGWY
jgi:hypothetical protein